MQGDISMQKQRNRSTEYSYVNGIDLGMEGVHIILLFIPYAKSKSA